MTMFCARCGKEAPEGAGFCTRCGANLGQVPGVQAPQKPSSARMALWIAAGVSVAVVLAAVTLVTVFLWVSHLDHQPEHVLIDGGMVVGADGEPIELVGNAEAEDVTWARVRLFLAQDKTDQIPYDASTFDCADFAETLHNNAEEAGIRTAYVIVGFRLEETLHAINAFNTTDKGLIYIDDTGMTDSFECPADRIVEVEVGEPYRAESVFHKPGCLNQWESLGTVASVKVHW